MREYPDTLPSLATTFIKRSRIAMLDGQPEEGMENLLSAAWACDDQNLNELSKQLRLGCVSIIDANPTKWEGDDGRIQAADIMRRAGLFDRAIELCSKKPFASDLHNKIAAFEIQMAREGRDGCFNVGHVLRKQPLPTE